MAEGRTPWRRALASAAPVVVSSAGASLLGVALLPVLLQLITPAAFAQYSALLAASLVLGSSATMKLEALLPQVPADRRAELQSAAILSALALSIVASLLAISVSRGSGRNLAIAFVALGFTTALISVGTYVAVSMGNSRRLATGRLLQAGSAPLLQIAFALLGARTALALVIADGAGRAMASVYLRPGFSRVARRGSWSSLIGVLRSERGHVSYFAPATLVNMAATQLPLILAPVVLTVSAAGTYSFAHRVALLPSALLALGLSQAFHHQFGVIALAGREVGGEVRYLHRRVCVLVGVGFLGLSLMAPPAVEAFLPREWGPSGPLISVLSVWGAAIAMAAPFGSLMIIAGRQRASLGLTVLDLLVKVAMIFVALVAASDSAMAFAVLLTVGTVAVAIVSSYRFLAGTGLASSDLALNMAIAVVPPLAGALLVAG